MFDFGRHGGERVRWGLTSKLHPSLEFVDHKLQNMVEKPLKAAILVVSITAAKDASQDLSEGVLRQVFEKDGGGQWEVEDVKIVSDNVLEVQRSITIWSDKEDAVDLIVTTGGTGFAKSDITPEVCNLLP